MTVANHHSAHRVLIVHREPQVAAELRLMLMADGYQVACAATTREARDVRRGFAPDLLVIEPGLAQLAGPTIEDLTPPEATALRFGDLVLDRAAHTVSRGGMAVALTATEFRLLHFLMSYPERVLTRAQLLEHVWEYDFGGDARVLETYVCYLRRKLEAHGDRVIHTVRGLGYVLRDTPSHGHPRRSRA